MKKVFRLLVFTLMLSILFFPAVSRADDSDYPFVITDYNVTADISESNIYSITETIAVNFNEPRHGIYRTIPMNSELTRTSLAGENITTTVESSVYDVYVEGYSYSADYYPNEVDIQIGDAGITLTGPQVYKLSYKIAFGDDGADDFDEAYFNILGTKWEAPVKHFSFSVTLPKAFDKNALGFSMGPYNAVGYDPDILKFSVDGNTISGELTKEMGTYEGLTMRLELPQGYFKLPDPRVPSWILGGAMAALAFIALILFLIFSHGRRTVRTVEFEPPYGMTPPEVAYVYKGDISSSDIVSLLIYWADKGFISITRKGKGFELVKLKNMYGEGRDYESIMFYGLFSFRDVVNTEDLKLTFSSTISSVRILLTKAFEREENKLFRNTRGLSALFYILFGLPIYGALAYALSGLKLGLGFALPMALTIGLPFFFLYGFLVFLLRHWHSHGHVSRVVILAVELALILGLFAVFLLIYLPGAPEPLMPIACILSSAVIGICASFLRRRTAKGREMLGRVLGFKDFIAYTESDRLRMMAEKDPNVFYHILPYAYVLGVSNKWIKKFECIAVAPPEWYSGFEGPFNTLMFMNTFHTTMNTITSQIGASAISYGSSSGGGGGSGFSGGGSSGGGGGGGGGGSW